MLFTFALLSGLSCLKSAWPCFAASQPQKRCLNCKAMCELDTPHFFFFFKQRPHFQSKFSKILVLWRQKFLLNLINNCPNEWIFSPLRQLVLFSLGETWHMLQPLIFQMSEPGSGEVKRLVQSHTVQSQLWRELDGLKFNHLIRHYLLTLSNASPAPWQ